MLGGATSWLRGCHSPVGSWVSSPVVGAEALRVGFDKASLPLSECSVSKELSAEASEAKVVTVNLCTTHTGICGSVQKQPNIASLSLCVHPRPNARLVLGTEMLWLQEMRQL